MAFVNYKKEVKVRLHQFVYLMCGGKIMSFKSQLAFLKIHGLPFFKLKDRGLV